ncbi:hypothetical protein ACTXT7_010781 [Hymenolepis weldensis]
MFIKLLERQTVICHGAPHSQLPYGDSFNSKHPAEFRSNYHFQLDTYKHLCVTLPRPQALPQLLFHPLLVNIYSQLLQPIPSNIFYLQHLTNILNLSMFDDSCYFLLHLVISQF